MRSSKRAIAALAALGTAAAAGLILSSAPAAAEPGTVVISQVYGGGGNSGAPLANDFVELFNRSATEVSLDGWSLQYASATGNGLFSGNPMVALSGTLAPGQYSLVQLSGGANGTPLPAPDATGTIAMAAGSGKVVLARTATGLDCNGGSTPCTAEQTALIADLVGYGSANFAEGAPAPTLNNTTAALRAGGGCADTDDNGADFTTGAPAPRTSATPAAPCGSDPGPTPTGEPCEVAATHEIAQVQGSGDATPLAGQTVRVEGVVTGDFQESDQLGGFFLQDPTPDADPATSDGLFAFTGSSFRDVSVGDRVLVTGRAVEFNGWTELSPVTAVDVCGTGTITPTVRKLPLPAGTTFEPVESMLLTFPEPLTATEHYQLGRFGELRVSSEGRLFQPTDRPGGNADRNARRTLLIDDGSNLQNPPTVPFTSPRAVRLGDVAFGVTGVLGYGFGSYRLQPTKPITFLRANPRPAKPAPVGGDVQVAALNTLNWFTTLGSRGADTAGEQQRQLAKLVATLTKLNADAVGLMEVENNGRTALDALVSALNAELGAGTYAALSHPFPGSDAIQVGIIYKPRALTPVGAARSSQDPVFRRPPLIQTFRPARGGRPFTMIVNHFKSKGCDGATGPDADRGDGQSCFNAERVRQAQAVLGLIGTLKLKNPMVLGDLNAYGEEDPIDTLEAAGLTSVTKKYVPASSRYSYVFDGQSGELDHALVDRKLLKRVTGATIWHNNADEPLILDYNTEFNPPGLYAPDAYRSSDHDPVLIGLSLSGKKHGKKH